MHGMLHKPVLQRQVLLLHVFFEKNMLMQVGVQYIKA